eukprot:gene19927-26631_t
MLDGFEGPEIRDYVPSFQRRKKIWERSFTIATGTVALMLGIERYNQGVSRTMRSVKRGLSTAIASWLEEQAGTPLYTLEDEDQEMANNASVLDLKSLQKKLAQQKQLGYRPVEAPVLCATVSIDAYDKAANMAAPHPDWQSAETPEFFQSTKFFAVLDMKEARDLFGASARVHLAPHEVLFQAGDPSESGIYIVVRGTLGVYGESVGDLDVVDGVRRSVTCIALEEGCLLVQVSRSLFFEFARAPPLDLLLYLHQGLARLMQVSRSLFFEFVRAHPRALLLYLQQGLARLWRVAHFMLSDYLQLQLQGPVKKGKAANPKPLYIIADLEQPAAQNPSTSIADLEQPAAQNPSTSIADLEQPAAQNPSTSITDLEQPAGQNPSTSIADLEQPAAQNPSTSTACHPLSHTSTTHLLTYPSTHPSISCRVPMSNASTSTADLEQPSAQNISTAGRDTPPRSTDAQCIIRNSFDMADMHSTSSSGRSSFDDSPIGLGSSLLSGASLSNSPPAVSSLLPPLPGLQEFAPLPGNSLHSTSDVPVGQAPSNSFLGGSYSGTASDSTGLPRSPDRLQGEAAKRSFLMDKRARLADFWDIIDVEEVRGMDDVVWSKLAGPKQKYGRVLPLPRGGVLQEVDWACGQFYLLAEGSLMAERKSSASNGSLISCAAFLSSTSSRCRVVALEPARLIAYSWRQLETMVDEKPALLVDLLLVAAHAMGPLIRRFISMGLNRVWLKSGEVTYQQGEEAECLYVVISGQGEEAECLFVVISGRVRLLHSAVHPVSGKALVRAEEELGRGEAVGAVWAITGGVHDSTALCVRDTELVRMSKAAFKVIAEDSPNLLSKLFSNIARRLVAAWDSRVRSSKMEKAGSSMGLAREEQQDGEGEGGGSTGCIARRLVAAWDSRVRSSKMEKAGSSMGLAVRSSKMEKAFTAVPRALPSTDSGGSLHQQVSGAQAKGEIVTIAVVPAGIPPHTTSIGPIRPGSFQQPPGVAGILAVKRLASALKEALEEQGPVLQLNSTSIGLLFPTAFERLDLHFYRSKITSWLSSQEEEFRFIILESDLHPTPWSSVCVAQADCILLIAAEGASPALGQLESALVFGPGFNSNMGDFKPPNDMNPVPSMSQLLTGYASNDPSVQPSAQSSFEAQCNGQQYEQTMGLAGCVLPADIRASMGNSAIPASFSDQRQLLSPIRSSLDHTGPANLASIRSSQDHTGPANLASMRSSMDYTGPTNLASDVPHASDLKGAAAAILASQPAPVLPPPLSTSAPSLELLSPATSSVGPIKTKPLEPTTTYPPHISSANKPGATSTHSLPAHIGDHAGHSFTSPSSPSCSVGSTGLGKNFSNTTGISTATGAPHPSATAAQLRRVELVMLHSDTGLPSGTLQWLKNRPALTRHHHIRLSKSTDIARLSRWMSGQAVGLVLSGGGSRGLAHLGVLCALEDLGVPIDVVGGTSQGAFMAALYAQGLSRDQLQARVNEYANNNKAPFYTQGLSRDQLQALVNEYAGLSRDQLQARVNEYAVRMGSMRHLLSDLTLPILSVFSGNAFDSAVQATFQSGASMIEDLWLNFFCGLLWRMVRASMTIVGLLPPVFDDGDLLVDGGYMNNIPVDVMRSLGVETVIVVDVEGKDDLGWASLTPYDGGVSGWRLLWDRWCPVPSWRSKPNVKLPRYSQIINQLTWMTHAHNLKRVSEDYKIDLYLRPPNIGNFKLMDYHLMDRIVKDAYRYANSAVSHWKLNKAKKEASGVDCDGDGGTSFNIPDPIIMSNASSTAGKSHVYSRLSSITPVPSATPPPLPISPPSMSLSPNPPAQAQPINRNNSISCMAMLQMKQGAGGGGNATVERASSGMNPASSSMLSDNSKPYSSKPNPFNSSLYNSSAFTSSSYSSNQYGGGGGSMNGAYAKSVDPDGIAAATAAASQKQGHSQGHKPSQSHGLKPGQGGGREREQTRGFRPSQGHSKYPGHPGEGKSSGSKLAPVGEKMTKPPPGQFRPPSSPTATTGQFSPPHVSTDPLALLQPLQDYIERSISIPRACEVAASSPASQVLPSLKELRDVDTSKVQVIRPSQAKATASIDT